MNDIPALTLARILWQHSRLDLQLDSTVTSAYKEYKTVLGISLPLLAYYFSEVAIGLTDLYIVGQLGSVELAAVGLGKTIVFGWLVMGFCILSMVSVLSAEALAQDRPDDVTLIVVQGFWLAVLIVIPGIVIVLLTPWLLRQMNYEAAMLTEIEAYLTWVVWMLIPALWFAVVRNFLTVMKKASVFLVVSIAAVVVNYLLNQLLVFGRLGFPALGVVGAAVATVFVNLLSLAILVMYAWASERQYSLDFLRQLLVLRWQRLWELTRLGLPAGAMQLLESGFFIVISMLIGIYGAAWLAANNVVLAVIDVNFIIALAMGEALAVRIAYYKGSDDLHMVRRLAWFGYAVTAVVTLSIMLLLLLRPQWVVELFMNPEAEGYAQTLEYAVILAGIAALFLIFDGYQVLSTWMLRGLKDTVVPVMIGVGGYWLAGIGLGALLSFGLGIGPTGLWWGFAIGLTTAGALLVLRVIKKTRPA
ncbi:MAG: MATE family efflux transporter [Natronospirillum sp.]|uniref:MATE family efflux transporter n=1 Tax=Natronospirillum sp. TaxID=2812955 RepID=UPI0025CD262A|nr:MATE family efflux transporter [Natronospirillum sp.]MCH8551508.1 MATE family efflux transporter [Natronospirillum sp.]